MRPDEPTGRVSAPSGQHRRKQRRKSRPAPRAAREWSVRYALGAYVAAFAIGLAISLPIPHHALRLGVGVFTADLGMLATLYPLYRRRAFTGADLGLRRVARPAAAVGWVVLAIIAYFAIAFVVVLLIKHGHLTHETRPLAQLHESTPATVLTGCAVAVSAPVVEEIFFRGFLYRTLRNRYPIWAAALIVGVLFGAVHAIAYPADTLPVKAAFGVIACLLYERTGSLYPGIVLHCLVDGSIFEASISHGQQGFAWAGFGAVCLLAFGYQLLRRPTRREIDAYRWRPGPLADDGGGGPP